MVAGCYQGACLEVKGWGHRRNRHSSDFMLTQNRLLAALAVVLVSVAVYVIPWRRPKQTPLPMEIDAGYINPAACARCHERISKTYWLTGMGRSLYRPRPENTVEDYKPKASLYNKASDRYYTLIERDGKFYQRRHQIGFGGKQTNIVEKQIEFVIGSGNHARSYLHRNSEGKLLEMPVSWYSEKGGYWQMSPGYDRSDQQDFRRAIRADCLFCHNGYPAQRDQIPEGIDCQRCHGPGRKHAETAGSGNGTPESIRSAIINPARLNRDRQLEVCMQCHLETTSSPLPNLIPRYGRQPFSYRPGEPLADSFIYFDHAPGAGYDDKFEIAHAAYRLRKSACFQASQMTCTTCHNPHDIPRGKEAVEHYVSVCRTCHSAAHTPTIAADANCIECHMPRRRADDAVHVVMTDHYIQRRAPSRDLVAPPAYRGEVVPYYPRPLPQTPEYELYAAIAQVQDESNLAAGIPRLRQAVEKNRPETPEIYFELANAYAKAGNPMEAIPWFDEALRRRRDFHPAAKEFAVALIATGQLTRAAELLERTAADAVVLANLGNVYLRQGKLEAAAQVLQRALTLDPDAPGANNLLAMLWTRKGDRTAAETYFRTAIAAQPDFAEAHNNLANLLASAADYPQAGYHFEKAIAANPAYAEAHHGYGMLLIVMQSYDKAMRELEETVRLNPNLAQAHADLADVLTAKDRIADAAKEYSQAIRLNPDHYESQLALGLILLRKGEVAEARAHLEKAAQSTDPDLRQAAQKALR